MACYTFKVGNEEFKVSSPKGDGTPISSFIHALNLFKEKNPIEFLKLLVALDPRDRKVQKLDTRNNREIAIRMRDNLAKYGIPMHVMTDEEWNSFIEKQNENLSIKIDSNAKSFFLDGEIYTRLNNFSVSDSIHELSHLLLAVMRGNNFKLYLTFIHTLYTNTFVKLIALDLQQAGTYSTNFELDFEEEAVVRFLEGIFTGEYEYVPELLIDGKKVDTMQYLNANFRDVVKMTFGIKQPPSLSILFKSLVADIPQYGSDMFLIKDMTSTGYNEMIQTAKESELIHALINYYASEDGGNLILEGLCS